VPEEIVKSRNNLASNLWLYGRLDEAAATFDASREAARRLGAGAGLLWATMELVSRRWWRGPSTKP
jgi:hypothetical protein